MKHVQQTGTETPPAETFEFEVEDTARDEKHPLSYYGIGVEKLSCPSTGAGDVEKTFSFKVSWTNDYTAYHWDAVPKSGTDTVAWYSKTFLLREKNDGKPGWNYSNEEYALTFWYDIEYGSMDLNIHVPGNDVYYRKAEFTNTYTYSETRYELPFTKTVKLGGSAAPGRETFELEIFDVGVGSMEEHAKELYTAAVTTNGAGDYDGKLVISGPADQVRDLVCEGFYVREKNAGGANWTYDDAVWHILPERTGYIVDVDAPLVNNPPADTQPETDANEYRLVIHATKREESENGVYYVDYESTGGQDDLHQHLHPQLRRRWRRLQQRVHHGKQDRRSGQAPCRRILRAEGQPGAGGLSGHLERQRHRALHQGRQRHLYAAGKGGSGGLCDLGQDL